MKSVKTTTNTRLARTISLCFIFEAILLLLFASWYVNATFISLKTEESNSYIFLVRKYSRVYSLNGNII
jgi:hypothetical protein